jgi:hypothetical protein
VNEPTNDDKIQQLVRSVLEAVDTRLAGVRAEMSAAANDVQHHHQQLLATVVGLQHRIDALSLQRTAQDGRIEHLQAELQELRTAAAGGAPHHDGQHDNGEHHDEPIDFSTLSRPLMNDVHVTSPIPIVPMVDPVAPGHGHPTDLAPEHHDVLVHEDEQREVEWAEANADAQADAEMIDLERLTRLLSDKLEHITLPTPE